MKKIVTTLITSILLGCSSGPNNFSIASAESAGFKRDSQKLYQMVGAVDGWSGVWNGETVELYQYENESAVNKAFFEPLIQPGNLSGWVTLCYKNKMAKVSKGNKACAELNNI